MLDEKTKFEIAKIIPMFLSDKDGEVLAAVNAIVRKLEAANKTIYDLVNFLHKEETKEKTKDFSYGEEAINFYIYKVCIQLVTDKAVLVTKNGEDRSEGNWIPISVTSLKDKIHASMLKTGDVIIISIAKWWVNKNDF